MSAPQIPNLLTSGRGGRRGGRGSGRGTSSRGAPASPETKAEQANLIVQATDADASISRISAVQAGYLIDPYALDLAPSSIPPGGFRRMPVINRGTYVRTTGIDKLVLDFLSSNPGTQKQIVSLGAGSDTRVFRLLDSGYLKNCVYHEVDFSENNRKKVAIIQRSTKLQALLYKDGFPIQISLDDVHSANYRLHAIDLRILALPEEDRLPCLLSIRPDWATLILSECCLTYLKPEEADAVIKYFMSEGLANTTPKGLVLYEPINPFDSFGQVMVKNLAARGIRLQSLQKYSSLEAQRQRLRMYGFDHGQRAIDLSFCHDHWVSEQEHDRLVHVEMLDEREELTLLMEHYCLAWGWHDGEEAPGLWKAWQDLEASMS